MFGSAVSVNQNLDFIFIINSGSIDIMQMRLCIVCKVIPVELIVEKSVIPTGKKRGFHC